jgi:hypothetical protein
MYKPEYFAELTSKLREWRGASARVMSYSESHKRLVLLLTRASFDQVLFLVAPSCSEWGSSGFRVGHRVEG